MFEGLAGPVLTAQSDAALEQGAAPSGRFEAGFFSPYAPQTAMDMIQRLPGFAFKDSGDSRGFNGNSGNVLVDGRRDANKSFNLGSRLRQIPARDVVAIELIRAGTPGVDMQGEAVLANVIRKSGSQTVGRSLVGADLLADQRSSGIVLFEVTRRRGEETLEFSAELMGYMDGGSGKGRRRTLSPDGRVLREVAVHGQSGGEEFESRISLTRPAFEGTLTLTASTDGGVWRSFYREAQTEIREKEVYRPVELSARWQKPLSDQQTLEVLLLQTYNRSKYTAEEQDNGSSSRYESTDTKGETIARATSRWAHSKTLSTELGAEAVYNFRTDDSHYSENGLAIALPPAARRVSEIRGEVFSQVVWKAHPTLSFDGGIRVERSHIGQTGAAIPSKTFVYVKPAAQITWTPSALMSIRQSLKRDIGQLNFGDFSASLEATDKVIVAGNPNLEPEKSWTTELRSETKFPGNASVVLTARHEALSDVLDRIPVRAGTDVFDAPGNIGSGTRQSLMATLKLPLGGLGLKGMELSGNGTWRWSEVTDPVTGLKRRISREQATSYNLELRQDLPELKLNWGATVQSPFHNTRYSVNEINRLKRRSWQTVYINWRPNEAWNIKAMVENTTARSLITDRTLFTGTRKDGSVSRREIREEKFRQLYSVLITRNF
ncbi:MAG: TonB-dependent receptor domain-containing protein [Asticcacaulis sp.]